MNLLQWRIRIIWLLASLFFLLMMGDHARPRTVYAAAFSIACNDVIGLIDAINAANVSEGPTTIDLTAGCTYTLTDIDNSVDGDNGLPDINADITIFGNGATLARASDAPPFRFFHVNEGGNLALESLTLTNGQAMDNLEQSAGSAILNQGTLTVFDSTIRNNSQSSSGTIYTTGTLVVEQSTFADNTANNGAAISAASVVTITESTFSNNQTVSDDGGAIFVGDGTVMTIVNSTFSKNAAPGKAGGALVTLFGPPSLPPDSNDYQ